MAMDKTVLAQLMLDNMAALSDADKADRTKTFEALADAFITHVRTAASISGACTGLTCPSGAVAGVASLPPGSID